MKSWQEFEFLPGVLEAIRLLKQRGFRVIVITNQRGISLGMFLEEDLKAIHERMAAELRKAGAALDAIYYCPHNYHSCDCRKPGIELFLRAQRDFADIQFADSVMIGDSVADMQAGERLACQKILVGADTAAVLAALEQENIQVDFAAPTLLDAVVGYLLNTADGGAPHK